MKKFFSAKKIVTSGNGVNEEWFSPSETAKKFDVAYLGRIHPRKRLELLIHAWREVIQKYPAAKLVIIGGGEPEYMNRYRMLIDDLRMSGDVFMTGFVDDASARKYLNSSRIFALPSSREGFGLSVVEAMACGLPCVLSDIPSFREIFSSSAILVRDSNPSLWGDALLELMGNKNEQDVLSNLSKELAKTYKWSDVADRELAGMLDSIGRSEK